jgi:hypothetical protein
MGYLDQRPENILCHDQYLRIPVSYNKSRGRLSTHNRELAHVLSRLEHVEGLAMVCRCNETNSLGDVAARAVPASDAGHVSGVTPLPGSDSRITRWVPHFGAPHKGLAPVTPYPAGIVGNFPLAGRRQPPGVSIALSEMGSAAR